MPPTEPIAASFIDRVSLLDNQDDNSGLLTYLQSHPHDPNEIFFTIYQLLHANRIRPAFILAIFLNKSGQNNPLISIAIAVGGILFNFPKEMDDALAQLRKQVESEPENREKQDILYQIIIPLITYLLTLARNNSNHTLLTQTHQLLCAAIPSFCPDLTVRLPAQIEPQSPTPTGKIHVIDHLFSFFGHHVAVNNAIRAFCQQQQWPAQFYIQHLPNHPFTLPEDVTPIFWGADGDKALGGLRNQQFFEELISNLQPHAQDQVIIHTLYDNMLIGLYHWLISLPERPKRLCIVLRFPPNLMLTENNLAPWVEPLFALGLQQLDSLRPQVRFFTDSITLYNYYHKLSGIRPTLLPISIDFDPLNALPPLPLRPERTKTRVLFIGDARGEKGFVLLPHAIKIVQSLSKEIEFDLHLANVNPKDQHYLNELRLITEGVILTENSSLFGEAYFQKIRSVDALLIPYSPSSYTYRTSHILVEALGSGCPVIATGKNSWMELFLAQFEPKPGVIMAEFSPLALAMAILEFHNHKQHFQQAAVDHAPRIRAENNLQRFMTLLLTDPQEEQQP